ncbi:hypothetical protein PDESU_06270 [Pontiella desulfatans]|uniref:Uncharacterized protein n=1 Tax=Pontiella desulfatans TaxID=2750659 RepID=A0A6C2UBX5_PONDE|nr:hypothetical protein [Pontiella desulfatans]VGO17668.1 hypothetical protein PDESU_06270 [Pontiella desulfatans]
MKKIVNKVLDQESAIEFTAKLAAPFWASHQGYLLWVQKLFWSTLADGMNIVQMSQGNLQEVIELATVFFEKESGDDYIDVIRELRTVSDKRTICSILKERDEKLRLAITYFALLYCDKEKLPKEPEEDAANYHGVFDQIIKISESLYRDAIRTPLLGGKHKPKELFTLSASTFRSGLVQLDAKVKNYRGTEKSLYLPMVGDRDSILTRFDEAVSEFRFQLANSIGAPEEFKALELQEG